jgi:hypothetical protein
MKGTRLGASAKQGKLSRKAREVAHPQLFRSNNERVAAFQFFQARRRAGRFVVASEIPSSLDSVLHPALQNREFVSEVETFMSTVVIIG